MRLRMGVLTISLCLALTACGGGAGIGPAEQLALDIRGELLETAGCTAQLELTADYGQRVYTYGIDLSWQRASATATGKSSIIPGRYRSVTAFLMKIIRLPPGTRKGSMTKSLTESTGRYW